MRVVIVGGGNAGISAATHLRRKNENIEIVVLEKSNEIAVASCGLPDLLSGKIRNKDDLIGATPAQLKNIFNIDVFTGTEVSGIDVKKKKLLLSNRKQLNYDRLILAIGAITLRPDIKGVLSENVFTIFNMASVLRVINYCKKMSVKKVVILGGGANGLALAEALLAKKINVVLIEKNNHPLADFDDDFGLLIKKKVSRRGLKIFTSSSVEKFENDKAFLTNGKKIKYDMAIISTGQKNEVKLPIMADIKIGKTGGIIVNEYMQTSVEDIFACGSNIETTDFVCQSKRIFEDIANIIKSAKIAADNVVGIKTKKSKQIRNDLIKVFDYEIAITGANENELNCKNIKFNRLYLSCLDSETFGGKPQRLFMKLLFADDGQILGMQMLGKKGVFARINVVANMILNSGSVQDMSEFNMAYESGFSKAKDALNILGGMALDVCFNNIKLLARENIGENDVVLDVSAQRLFIPSQKYLSFNMPLSEIRNKIPSLPSDKRTIVVANNGYAAYLGYCILSQRGFDNVYLLNSPDIWQ